VQSSIKRNLGLTVEKRKVPPAEFGIAEKSIALSTNKPTLISLSHTIEGNETE